MAVPESNAASIAAFLDRIKGRRLLIQTHDVPDPDALASAEAFRMIADVLVSGDPSLYKPTEAANTHWRHRPEGGSC